MTNIPVQAGELVALDYLNEVSRAHWRVSGTVDAVTAGTVDLLGGQITINAGAMSSNRKVTCEILFDILYNHSNSDTLALDLRFGGASLASGTGFPFSTTAAGRGIGKLWAEVANLTSTTQIVTVTGFASRGIQVPAAAQNFLVGLTASGTINTATAQAVELFAQWNTGTAGNSMRQLSAIVEVH